MTALVDITALARKAAAIAVTDLIDDVPGLHEVLEFAHPEMEALSDSEAAQIVDQVRKELGRIREGILAAMAVEDAAAVAHETGETQ